MITLNDLFEGSLLRNLQLRFQKDLIYTFTGNILIAVNPYKDLPIYGKETIRAYSGKLIGQQPPHVFAIANEAYISLLRTRRDQCIVIRYDDDESIEFIYQTNSGESGAGKTESTKFILNYLATVSSTRNLIHDQLLDASPILEAFGNAKTVRNNNSSRFGKFLKVQFEPSGSICGALTQQYLLEKVRL